MPIIDGAGIRKGLKHQLISLSATGTVVAAVPGRRIKVFAVKAVADAALSVRFRSGATTALEGNQALAANGGYIEQVSPPSYLFATAVGEGLDLVITGVGNVGGRISYWDEDAT